MDGQKMSYGSKDAICTYDNMNNNKCILDGKIVNIGGMCAHKLYVVDGFAVMTCSKNFVNGIKRKARIVKISDGTLIGEIGVPQTDGYIASPVDDTLAVL